MPQGPFLIFGKSALESLNLDEAVMLDNFYMSNITPLFFVECLADLEKAIRSNTTPEQYVGSLATRTPESQSYPNVHHATILRGELSGKFDLNTVHGRVVLAGGRNVQLGDKKGVIFEHSPEAEAVSRWSKREFLEVERHTARQWRRALTGVDLKAMAQSVATALGPWRKPNSLQDARKMTDIIIDNMDPEWLIRFGLNLLGAPEKTVEYVVNTWVNKRRPPLRDHLPYFVFMLKINIFFCLVLPTQLLSNVKASHKIDLAYLYYLPFCSVFTSNDNFHADIVPLFLTSEQTFVKGTELKEDLKRLVAHYEALPEDVLKTGLIHFAAYPPDDTGFLTTRLWDKYLPGWRAVRDRPKPVRDPEEEKRLVEEINRQADSPELQPSDENDVDKMDYATIRRMVHPQKGRWLRFSEEQIQRILEHEKNRA